MTTELIKPHGGKLVNCFATGDELKALQVEAKTLKSIKITKKTECDLEMIGIGAFSPLNGFVSKKDYESIVEKMRLANGLAWPIPISLQVKKDDYEKIKNEKKIVLIDDLLRALKYTPLGYIF